jgi:hypothetical protein
LDQIAKAHQILCGNLFILGPESVEEVRHYKHNLDQIYVEDKESYLHFRCGMNFIIDRIMTNLERRTVCFFENDMILSITFIMQKAFQIKPDIEVLKQLLQRNPTSYVVTYMMVNAKHCLFLAQVILFSALIADCLLNVNLVQES